LFKSEIFKKDGTKETWAYTYDASGIRIGKGRLKNEEVSDGLEEETNIFKKEIMGIVHFLGSNTKIM